MTEYKHNLPIPYSLHDMRVKKIIIQDKTHQQLARHHPWPVLISVSSFSNVNLIWRSTTPLLNVHLTPAP